MRQPESEACMSTAFPIRNENDYHRALDLVDQLWDAHPGTPEADVLDIMATLISVYEKATRELPPADPIALIRFKLRELGWTQRELGRRLGWGSGRVSEVLARKRPLTLRMVQDLGRELGIAPGLLVCDRVDDQPAGAPTQRSAGHATARAQRRQTRIMEQLEMTENGADFVSFARPKRATNLRVAA